MQLPVAHQHVRWPAAINASAHFAAAAAAAPSAATEPTSTDAAAQLPTATNFSTAVSAGIVRLLVPF